jgi:hypothetical protein
VIFEPRAPDFRGAGFLYWGEGIVRKIFFLLVIGILLQVGAGADDRGGLLIISTDKSTYVAGEPIRVNVQNRSVTPLFCHAVSTTPTFFIDHIEEDTGGGKWQEVPVRCHWPECDIDFDGPGSLNTGKTVSFEWIPVQHDKLLKKDVRLEPGRYRLVGSYQIRPEGTNSKQWDSHEVRSNEFVIEK